MAEDAGEDDGHGGAGGSVGAGEFAEHADAAEGAVFEVAPELFLEGAGAGGEGGVGGGVGFEEDEVGEVADEVFGVGVDGEAVADGDVEGEAGFLGPGGEGFGVGGAEEGGGGQAAVLCVVAELFPAMGVEGVGAAGEAGGGVRGDGEGG